MRMVRPVLGLLLLALVLPRGGLASKEDESPEIQMRTAGALRGRVPVLGRHVEHTAEVLLPPDRLPASSSGSTPDVSLVLELPGGERRLPLRPEPPTDGRARFVAELRLEELLPAPEGRRVAVFPDSAAGLASDLLVPGAHDWLPMAVAPGGRSQPALDVAGAQRIGLRVEGPGGERIATDAFMAASEAAWVVVAEPIQGVTPGDLAASWRWSDSIGDGPVWRERVEVGILRVDRALRLAPEAEWRWQPGCWGKDKEHRWEREGLAALSGFDWTAPGLEDLAAGAWFERYPTTLLGYAGRAPDPATFAAALGALARRLEGLPPPEDADQASRTLAETWLAVHEGEVPHPEAASMRRDGTLEVSLGGGMQASGARRSITPPSRWQPLFQERLIDDDWLRSGVSGALWRLWAHAGGRQLPTSELLHLSDGFGKPIDLEGQGEARAAARLEPFLKRQAERFFHHPEPCDLRNASWWWIASREQRTGTASLPTVTELRTHFTSSWARAGLGEYTDAEVEQQIFLAAAHFASSWTHVLLGERSFRMSPAERLEELRRLFSRSVTMTPERIRYLEAGLDGP